MAQKEIIFPFQWEGWDSIDSLMNNYYGVEFLEDFGPFKAGEKLSSLSVDYGNGIIEAYNEAGTEVVKRVEWKAKPVAWDNLDIT
jgi:hypothetical protein